MPKKTYSGFTLIELMIVVTIITILASLAIPTYKNYTKHARFAELVSLASPFKTAITLALQSGIALQDLETGTNGIPAEPASTKNLASLKVKKGIITATGSKLIDGVTYVLTPNSDGNTWQTDGTCKDLGWCNE